MNENLSKSLQIWQQPEQNWLNQITNNTFFLFLLKIILASIVFIIIIIISKYIAHSIRKKILKNSITDDEENALKVWNLIWDIIFYILFIFGVVIGFQIIWFDLWIILWWISFWLWFAFKEILSNMMAGIIILTTKDYKLWDLIEIEWKYDYIWYIEEITIRYTTIRSFYNQKIIIPSLELLINPVKTITSEEFIRWEVKLSINYNEDIETVKKIIINTINNNNKIIHKDKTSVIIESFGDNWINLLVWFYYDPNWDIWYFKIKSEIYTIIKNTFKENNINISYPHTTLTVDKNDQNLLKTILFTKK